MPEAPPSGFPPIPNQPPGPIECVVINGVEYALVPTGRTFVPVAPPAAEEGTIDVPAHPADFIEAAQEPATESTE
jgi:hypothetical protein